MIKGIALSLLGIYLLGGLALFWFQRTLLYFPSPDYAHTLDTIRLNVEGEVVSASVLNAGKRSALIYFGGNAEPVIFNEVPFTEHFQDHTVYLVDYRGYGGSTGSPTETVLYQDALALYDHLTLDHENIDVIGRSLGSGVATYLAAKRPIGSLILVTPFDSILNVAKKRFAIYPVSWLLQDKYDSIGRVADINSQTLILIAEKDAIIPPDHACSLSNSFKNEQVTTVTIAGADHNNISLSTDYYRLIQSFLNSGAGELMAVSETCAS